MDNGFAMDVAWVLVPNTQAPLLAYGGDDHKIYLLAEQNQQFVVVQKLLGHDDWIRCLEFTTDENNELLLASCAQDRYIRIWRLATVLDDDKSSEDLCVKQDTLTFQQADVTYTYGVSLESVLLGHENWIYGLHWKSKAAKGSSLCLMSASMDKTVVIWEPDPDSGVWMEKVRVGEVGGSLPGFFGGVFSPDGMALLAHGYQGAFQLWRYQEQSGDWQPSVTFGGHFDAVHDLAWEPEGGEFLLSVSADQSTRLHGYWNSDNGEQRSWHELVRPQVHGYDMTCISMINRYSFASGADEKVIRVFEAPQNFIENFGKICKVDVSKALKEKAPQGASVPALGLSNKAVYEGDQQKDEPDIITSKAQYPEVSFNPVKLEAPPTEVDLIQNTLWPETQKLYGHGNEIFTMACHPQGTLLATSCKAQQSEQASVLLWDTSSWRQVTELTGHSLTVTQLAFSHSGQYLLSVSRDRTWTVYKQRPEGTDLPVYSRVAYSDKKTSVHSRIIWSCAWSHDDKYFVTVSRDKKAIIWNCGKDTGSCTGVFRVCSTLDLPDSITAVDFAPLMLHDKYVLAFGLDTGSIHVYNWCPEIHSWTLWTLADQRLAHHLCVRRLRFRPCIGQVGDSDDRFLQLASCGLDHLVKIYTLDTAAL